MRTWITGLLAAGALVAAGCGGDADPAADGTAPATAATATAGHAGGDRAAIRDALIARLRDAGWTVDASGEATRTVEGEECRIPLITDPERVRDEIAAGEDVAIDRLAQVGARVTDRPRPCIRAIDRVLARFDVERVRAGGG